MEYTIVQHSKYNFDIYEHVNNTKSLYLGKVSSIDKANKICYDRMNNIQKYGKINKILVSHI